MSIYSCDSRGLLRKIDPPEIARIWLNGHNTTRWYYIERAKTYVDFHNCLDRYSPPIFNLKLFIIIQNLTENLGIVF